MKLPKALTSNKCLLDGLIFRMRFQDVDHRRGANVACMAYTAIASIVGKSTFYCRKVCRE